MRFMVLRVQDFSLKSEAGVELAVQVQLVLEPQRGCKGERPKAPRSHTKVRVENALELEQGLVVKPDVRQVARRDATGAQAVLNRASGKRRVPFLAAETLLLRCRDDLPVPQQASGAVVVERRDA